MSQMPDTVNAFLEAVDNDQAMDPALLTWYHPRFGDFVERFRAALECYDDTVPCQVCDDSLPVSRSTLKRMGGFDVQRSVAWLHAHGGLCGDCAVNWHVVHRWLAGREHLREVEETLRRAEQRRATTP